MRGDSSHPIMEIWTNGPEVAPGVYLPGVFLGDNKPQSRVTVQPLWWLNGTVGPVGTFDQNKLPLRWFYNTNNPIPDMTTEVEVPNLQSVDITMSLDQDAGQATIVMYDSLMNPINVVGPQDVGPPGASNPTQWLGQPGYYSPNYMESAAAQARWGGEPNYWSEALTPNALIRTYQGFGGYTNGVPGDLATLVADQVLEITGTWLVDEVDISTNGTLTLKCRDMSKLLIDQMVYPPLIPIDLYPLHYQAFYTTSYNSPVPYGPDATPPNSRWITKALNTPASDGYWLVGSDGGVFTFGSAQFYGSLGGKVSGKYAFSSAGSLDIIICDILPVPGGNGYRLVSDAGIVYNYGVNVAAVGDAAMLTLNYPITAAVAQPGETNDGYWMLSTEGGVFAFGSAVYYGSGPMRGSVEYVDIVATVSGNGYWLVDANGEVYSFGDAVYYGGSPSSDSPITAMDKTPDGLGYVMTSALGGIFTFGDAQYYGSIPLDIENDDFTVLNALITDIRVDQAGYRLFGLDGGVFDFGDSQFYGALAGAYSLTTDGNMGYPTDSDNPDYVRCIADMLLWSGFYAYPEVNEDGSPAVFGTLEPTGAYPVNSVLGGLDPAGQIADDIFNKMPPMNSITTIKEIVGYIFTVKADGSAYFVAPNVYAPGNFLNDGTQISFIPVVDESLQITSYTAAIADQDMRSEIIIASFEPLGLNGGPSAAGTVSSTYTPHQNINYLRGLVKPAEWIDEFFVDEAQQQLMAELTALMIWQKLRQGALTCVANPLFELDDQIQIMERQSGETFINYINSIHTNHNVDQGTYLMDITTNWLGDDTSWSINSPEEFTLWSSTAIPNTSGQPLTVPASPNVAVVGPTGSTKVWYGVTATTPNGETTLGAVSELTNSNGTLNQSDYNAISWTAVDTTTTNPNDTINNNFFQIGYNVYKSTDNKTYSFLGTTTDTTLNDTGQDTTDQNPPAINTATTLEAPGSHTVTCYNNNLLTGSPTISGTGFSIEVGSVLVIDTSLNREIVNVTAVDSGAGTFTASFSVAHPYIYTIIGIMDNTDPNAFLP